MLRPGVRWIGRAVAVNREVVTVFLEGRPDSIAMPLSSIGKLEVSERRSVSTAIIDNDDCQPIVSNASRTIVSITASSA